MAIASDSTSVAERSREFLDWLGAWYAGLQPLPIEALTGEPDRLAMCSVDLINGFCTEGALASPRVAALVPRVTDLFHRAHDRGVRHFILAQDTHSPDAVEFGAFARHCVRGTSESQTVPELASLPFAGTFAVFEKNSIRSVLGTPFENWVREHPEVDTFVCLGDCTDLCVYQMAMDLRLMANAADLQRRVIVPANAVDTYDLPVAVARQIGALPHDAEFLHLVFLYQMALNGIEVVREIR